FPVEKVNKTFRNNRRIGLGIMGFADMLYQMRIPYNSKEGFATGRKVMKLVNDAAHAYSEKLATEKAIFPNWEISIFGPKGQNRKHRNSALTTIAPTGSISMIVDCSSGVEPFFALAYYKEVMGGQKLMYLNPYLEAELKKLNLNTEEIREEIQKTGSVQHIAEIPAETRRVYVTAMDISAEAHIEMQAAFQEHVDNSISKTINFPNSATREDVRNGYIMAWESGLKGCTVYRDGSRQEQVLNLHKETPKKEVVKQPVSVGAQTTAFEEILPPPVSAAAKIEREHMTLNKKEIIASKKCPECGSSIQVAEGCMLCLSCGFSVCSVGGGQALQIFAKLANSYSNQRYFVFNYFFPLKWNTDKIIIIANEQFTINFLEFPLGTIRINRIIASPCYCPNSRNHPINLGLPNLRGDTKTGHCFHCKNIQRPL
ncbi:MAG: hypothetical protein WC873_01845, partial [Candidatus Gracilibacteria bacterium]